MFSNPWSCEGETMRRAVVVFLEDKRELMLQFGCLYTSLKYTKSKDTDLVVFGTPEALKKIPDDCIKIECNLVDNPPFWLSHRYINSVSCFVSEHSQILEKYDFLLKSDVDTFLTPAWNSYYPKAYSVGKGSYIYSQEVIAKIKKISKDLGLVHRGIHNVGSTHYGPPALLREVCGLSASVAGHIMTQEFKDGPGQWPGWYQGVTLMYSNEIAVNHFVPDVSLDYEKLDYDSVSHHATKLHPHIHCWHTDVVFSKFQFIAGNYNHMRTENLDLSKIKDYCLYIALKSRKELPFLVE